MKIKKKILFLSVFLLIVIAIVYVNDSKKVNRYQDCIQIKSTEVGFEVIIFYNSEKQILYPWYDEISGVWEIFLPSYLNDGSGAVKVYINAKSIQIPDCVLEDVGVISLNDKMIYTAFSRGKPFKFRINLSDNISSLFIETKSRTMVNVDKDKQNKESGKIYSVSREKTIEYVGGISEISGHGNGTWMKEKKPYSLKLCEEAPLAGMDKAKEWVLLALHYEGDKIHSKIAYDLEKVLGGFNISECTWVDVYFNGNYNGLYLLIHSIKGREAFQFEKDGFLLEKEMSTRLLDNYFVTQHDEGFVVKKSANSTLEEISDTVQKCEDAIYAGTLDESLIDIESFVIQFLINKISMNFDSFRTSSYYYKLDNDSKIYSGPCWDYDGAFGEYLHQGKNWVNPKGSIFEGDERLEWYEILYKSPFFRACIYEKLVVYRDEIEYLINQKIDEYVEYIQKSVENDSVRWKVTTGKSSKAGTYQNWENNVRYLKYFLKHRIKYLYTLFEVKYAGADWLPNDVTHTIRFKRDDDIIKEIKIPDGDNLEQYIDEDDAWYFEYSGEKYNKYLPILEDCTLISE